MYNRLSFFLPAVWLLVLPGGVSASESTADTTLQRLRHIQHEAEQRDDTVTVIKALNDIGKIYTDRGENPEALAHYQQGLALAEQLGDQRLKAHLLKNTGVLYVTWKNFEKGLEYYDRAHAIAEQLDEPGLLADCYNNQGTVYEQLERYDQALEVYGKALGIYEQYEALPEIAMSYSNMAIVHKQRGDYAQAIELNLKALPIMEQLGETWMQAATLNNIGSVYLKMGQYRSTIRYAEQSAALADSIQAKEVVVAAYQTLAEAAEALRDYRLAYAYMAKFHTISQEFINSEKTRQFSELEVKYQTAEKEQRIALLDERAKVQDLKLGQRNLSIIIILGLFVLSGVIAYLLFNRRKLRQEAAMQAAIRAEQEHAARAVIEAEENERKRIAGDLHDGLGQLLSVAGINLGVLATKISFANAEEQETFSSTRQLLQESYAEMRNISHQMMPDALLKQGLPGAVRSLLGLIDPVKLAVHVAAENLDGRLDATVEIMLYRVIQECVNNAIKHADARNLHIQLSLQDGWLICTVEDDGKGFDPQAASGGIGMKNIRSRIAFVKGELEINSAPGHGTSIVISIPLR